MSPRRAFRILSLAEAVTWAGLIVAMLLKYGAGADSAVSVAGPIHGFVFIAYVAGAAVLAVNQRWSAGATVLAVAAAVVPFATLPLEIVYDRRGLLAGPWRRTATEDPRDRRLPSRMLRWSLARPLAAGAVLVAAVAVAFAALLVAGPPGGSA